MDIFKNIKAALTYANYDFYKLKKEIVNLIKRGRNEGFGNPDYCKLMIKNSSVGHDYPVQIDLYYKTSDNEVIHLPQELMIGTFSTIPTTISNALISKGYVDIRIDNLAELGISADEEVSRPISFNSLSNFTPNTSFISRTITIKDEVFTYRVIFTYTTTHKEEKSKAITYADIRNIPLDVISSLAENGSCTINID